MRLIDADELKEQLKERYEKAYKWRCETTLYKDKADGEIAAFLEAVRTLNNAPTVDAVERKKGKWIRNSNGTYSCSLCQSWIPNEQRYYANYCLFCGADMRGETNENNRC